MTSVGGTDRIAMGQRQRDVSTTPKAVLAGKTSQADAALHLGRSTRQVRRLLGALREHGDRAVVRGLTGRPSNHRADGDFEKAVLDAYARYHPGFGPTLAAEMLEAEHQIAACHETLRRWLLDEGLWQRRRQHEPHRSRRPRRACFGELVQIDASIHDRLEGRGERIVLIALIDDATSRAGALLPRRRRRDSRGPVRSLAAPVRPAPGRVQRPAQHLRAAGRGRGVDPRRYPVRTCARGAGRGADPRQEPAGQGAHRAPVRHGPGPLGQADASPGRAGAGPGQRGAGGAAARAQPAPGQEA